MRDFDEYTLRIAERKAAYERCNYASAALDLANVYERLAEITGAVQSADKGRYKCVSS